MTLQLWHVAVVCATGAGLLLGLATVRTGRDPKEDVRWDIRDPLYYAMLRDVERSQQKRAKGE